MNLYNSSDIPVKINVTDSFSGIKTIEWSVLSTDEEAASKEAGIIEVDNYGDITGDVNELLVNSKEKNIITSMSKILHIRDNSNSISLEVKITDNSGNISNKKLEFSNDTTAPKVSITYDNNSPDTANTKIFKNDRTATITVAERNFNESDIRLTVANLEGSVPKLSEWKFIQGNGNLDNNIYTATISFVSDGKYTFDFAYNDIVGNVGNVEYINSVSTDEFIIDKTKPMLSISYDSNDGNNTYYKDQRTSVLTVNEHNFDASRASVSVLKDGVAEGINSTWQSNGDVHTLDLGFTQEAQYAIQCSFIDMAGNTADNVISDNFFVDKSEPNISLQGVDNNVAYGSGNVGFSITGSDKYFESLSVSLVQVDVNGNRNNIKLSETSIDNGKNISVDNLQNDGVYELNYTINDKAARSITNSITFSVNRNGSTYTMSQWVSMLNMSYNKSLDNNIVISEINVNELQMDSVIVTLTRGSASYELKKGVDFTVDKLVKGEQWCEYTYTINKSCFVEDGVYSVSLASKDKAGNVSASDIEAKKAELSFVVDKTAPICNVLNLNSDKTYAANNKTVEFSVSDNILLSSVSVMLEDKNILSLKENEIKKIVDSGKNISFDVGSSDNARKVVISYVDKAGNESSTIIDNFYVTTSLWIRYKTNTTWIVISIAIGAVLIGGVSTGIVIVRKKENR